MKFLTQFENNLKFLMLNYFKVTNSYEKIKGSVWRSGAGAHFKIPGSLDQTFRHFFKIPRGPDRTSKGLYIHF